MTKVQKSIFYFGIYMIIVGIGLMLIPNVLLSLVRLPQAREVWIRIGGLLTAIVGGYYLEAAKHNLVPFFRATVWGRTVFALGLAMFVLFKMIGPIILIASFIDVVCALYTLFHLRSKT